MRWRFRHRSQSSAAVSVDLLRLNRLVRRGVWLPPKSKTVPKASNVSVVTRSKGFIADRTEDHPPNAGSVPLRRTNQAAVEPCRAPTARADQHHRKHFAPGLM